MKLFKKICIGLTALLLTASPMLTHITNFQTVKAARKSKGKITLFKNDYVYNQAGNKIKLNDNHGYRVPSDFAVSPTGYLITDMKSDDFGDHRSSQPYYGTKKINGQKFYDLGHNYYVNEANVLKVRGRNVAQGTLTIKRDALVYTKTGKATGKKLRTNSVVKYQGKAKAATKTPKYFYYLRDVARYLQPQSIPTYKIKGKYFYSLGHNRYINAANVGYINGHVARYNGTSTATVLKNTNSITVNYSEAKRKLKKGQKIKLDLAVIPYLSDGFDNYLYRLHGHPDEYVDATEIKLQRDLPVIDYRDLVYTYVTSLSGNGNSVELYDFSGKAIGKRIIKPLYSDITVDGLMYIWVPEENKAELFYHCLNYSDDNVVDDSHPDPIQDPDSVHRTNNKKLNYGNNFIKVSDVKIRSGLKLKALNTIEQAEKGQRIATSAEKQELLALFNEGKDLDQNANYDTNLMNNYDSSLSNASAVIRSDKATIAQVDEAVWYLKTAKKQLTTMSVPAGD